MGVISNVIKTVFTSSGAGNVANEIDSLNRAQTRLGQASVGASRSFAAQSQGLGGLVAAYAGAAATLFAVQAAYEALAQAAKAETMVRGTNALAAATAQSGPTIIKTIKDITDGQLTMAEAAQNANTALAAGFSTKQIEELAIVAQKASLALGRDFTDSLQRIVRGVAKLEPELLDELGIFTRIEPAVQKYARQLGISANTLNEFQRRQAFANAAIDEGNRKFSMIDTTSSSLQKTLEQLRVNVSELFTTFMQIIGSALAPFVEFLNNNVGAGLLAFGFLLSKVFGKATQEIGSFTLRAGATMSGWADSIADKAEFAEGKINSLRSAIQAPISPDKGGGLKGIRTTVRAGQDPEQAKRFAAALETQRTAEKISPSQLNAINIAYKEQLAVLEKLGSEGTQSYKNLTAAVERNQQAITSAGGRITKFISLSNTLNFASKVLTITLRGLGAAVEGLFFFVSAIQLIGTLFDVDLIGSLLNMFKDLSNASKELANGFKGVALAAAGGGSAVTAELKRIGANEEQISNFGTTIIDVQKRLESLAKQANVVSAGRGGVYYAPVTNQDLIEAATQEITRLQKVIAEGENEWFGFWGNGADEIEALKVELVAAEAVLATFRQGSESVGRVIGQIAITSGLSAEQIAKTLTPEITNSSKALEILGITLEKVNGAYSLENLTSEQRKLIDATVLSRNTAMEFSDAIKAGAVSVTSAGATLAGLEANLLILKTAYNDNQGAVRDLSAAELRYREGKRLEIEQQELVIDKVRAVEAALIDVEKRYTTLTSVFSADIKILDTAQAQGILDAFGKVALTQDQINANQATWLSTQIKNSAYAKDLVGDQKAIEAYAKSITTDANQQAAIMAKVSKDAELYAKATEAVEGRLVNIVVSLNDMAKSYDSITEDINNQLRDLADQQAIAPLQFVIDEAKFKEEAAKSAASFQEEFIQNKIKLAELGVDTGKLTPLEGAQEVNKLNSDLITAQKAAAAEQFALANETLIAERNLLASKYLQDAQSIKDSAQLQRDKIKSDYDALVATARVYSEISSQIQQAAVDGGNSMGQAIVSAINSGVKALVSSLGPLGALFSVTEATFTPITAPTTGTIAGPAGMTVPIATELDKAINTLNTSMQGALNSVSALEEAQLAANDREYTAAADQILKQQALLEQQYKQETELLRQAGLISEEEAINRIKKAKDLAKASGSADEAVNGLTDRLLSLFNSIKGVVESTLMDLNNLVFYGEGNFRDILGNMFKSMQQTLFQQTIVPTLSDKITTGIFGLLGVKVGSEVTKGERGLTYEGNALLVKMVNTDELSTGVLPSGGLGDPTDPTKPLGFFEQIFGPNSFLVKMFQNIFGQNGILSGLFKGLFGQGGIMSGIFSGILSIFTGAPLLASGGMLHLAQGGAAASSLVRDRIPAMLEPGEFVVRKPIVSAVGIPAMQSLNATGKMSGEAPVINFTNEGSPKSVTAAPPRFDGEKYVIDIITRDLANNGPIRKTLRGGF